jgi:hypothetical protein
MRAHRLEVKGHFQEDDPDHIGSEIREWPNKEAMHSNTR